MKISKKQLRRIIRESIMGIEDFSYLDTYGFKRNLLRKRNNYQNKHEVELLINSMPSVFRSKEEYMSWYNSTMEIAPNVLTAYGDLPGDILMAIARYSEQIKDMDVRPGRRKIQKIERIAKSLGAKPDGFRR